MFNFKKSYSNIRPDELDTTSSPTTVYIRKNITEIENSGEDGEELYMSYSYDEAAISKLEYATFLAKQAQANVDFIAMMTGVDI